MSTQVKIPLTLEMSEAAYLKIVDQVEGDGDDAQKLAAFVNEALDSISKGAMLLSPDTAERLCNIDERLVDDHAIIHAVERGLGVSDGAMVARWKIDPSLHESIRQRAEVQGMTPEGLVQEMMDQAVALGWFWDLEARVKYLFLTREQNQELLKIFEVEEITSDVIMQVAALFGKDLKGNEEAPAAPAPASDSTNPGDTEGKETEETELMFED
jgi:hypothetical protein